MKTKQLALEVLEVIYNRRKQYDALNSKIRKIQTDFPNYIQDIDIEVEAIVVKLLDYILGDEIASYWLYEASDMKNGGMIVICEKEYPIKTFEDVIKFVNRKEK